MNIQAFFITTLITGVIGTLHAHENKRTFTVFWVINKP